MGSKNPIGGVQPPLLQSASSHCRLSGILPESGEEEGPSRCSGGNGDERGNRSRKDSFSGLLQSALFSAESRGDMEVYNRPLGSEHPHPVSVLQDGDQWVTSQSPSKRAMAHHSGFERRYTFTSPLTPPTGNTSGSATRAWFGNSELFLLG